MRERRQFKDAHPPPWLGIDQFERALDPCREMGRRRRAIDEWPRPVHEISDDDGGGANERARNPKRLAASMHDDDIISAQPFAQPASARAEYARRMGFVDDENGLVSPRQFCEIGQRRKVAVHAVDRLDSDKDRLRALLARPATFRG